MKWFRHDAGAHLDAKLQKVRIKYGLEGYGLYFYCLELIAMNIDEKNLTFELEHDSEIIAFNTGVHYERVQEILTYMVGLELFENNNGMITCYKLANRLDQSMTSNPKMRSMIAKIKENPDLIKNNHDAIMTQSEGSHDSVSEQSCKTRLDKTRLDKKETKKKKHPLPSNFSITEEMKTWFNKQSFEIDINQATDRWCDSMRADENKFQYTDWVSTWRNGMRKAQEWHSEKKPKPVSQISNVRPMMPKAGSQR